MHKPARRTRNPISTTPMLAKTNRRKFLKQAAVIGMPMIIPSSVLGRNGQVAPSNKITIGGVGLGPRGRKVLSCFLPQPDVQFVTIADPQKDRRETIKKIVDRTYENQDCTTTWDMFDVYERDDIDAIIIATGDRWHALGSMLAAKHGKDVYSEKPCAMTIRECQELDDTIRRYGRVYQAGTQRRNVPNFQVAAKLALTGKLGNMKAVHAGILPMAPDAAWLPAEPEPDPEIINWNRWLGPSPWRPYNNRYCKGGWRGHGGLNAGWKLLEWGSHTVDLCQWAAGADETTPIEFESEGNDRIEAKYANGVKLIMRLSGFKDEGDWHGLGTCPVLYEGDEGWVEAGDKGKLVVSDPKLLEGIEFQEMGGTDPIHHVREFLDCIKSRGKTASNSTAARRAHVASFAGAIGWKLGRKMKFDPVTETFPDDPEANRLRSIARRGKWHV